MFDREFVVMCPPWTCQDLGAGDGCVLVELCRVGRGVERGARLAQMRVAGWRGTLRAGVACGWVNCWWQWEHLDTIVPTGRDQYCLNADR